MKPTQATRRRFKSVEDFSDNPVQIILCLWIRVEKWPVICRTPRREWIDLPLGAIPKG